MAFEQIGTLGRYPEGREMFFPDGRLIEVGEVLKQPALAETLENLVADGADYLYRGTFAKKMVETVRRAGGVMTLDDLDRYEARWMEPARGTYRGFDVVGSLPPDTGGSYSIEADIDEAVRGDVSSRGLGLDICNPWNFHLGNYEGVHIAEDGTMSACADPRRAGKALAA